MTTITSVISLVTEYQWAATTELAELIGLELEDKNHVPHAEIKSKIGELLSDATTEQIQWVALNIHYEIFDTEALLMEKMGDDEYFDWADENDI